MRPVLLLACLLALPAAAPPPAVPLYKSFGRWFVACDNIRSCEARGFDEVTRADLRVIRDAGPAAPANLVLSVAEGALDRGALRLDGAPLDLSGPAWTSAGGGPDSATLSTSDPQAIAAFIAAARNAHALTLDPPATSPGGAPAASAPSDDASPRLVPLDGFTAALLLMDAVQGRPSTPTALIAPAGPGRPPPAPPLPPAPAWVRPAPLTAAEARTLVARARGLSSPEFGTCPLTGPADVAALDAAHAIAIRSCYLAAYQSSSLVVIFPRRGGGAPRPVHLTLPGVPGDSAQGPDMVEPSFDPATGQLSTAAKGRGLGDCGLMASWTWSGGAFRLTSLAYQDQCGGAEPGDSPVLFRVRSHR